MTAPASSWSEDLLEGLAEHLDAAGVGTWATDRDYRPDEVGIALLDLPDQPDRVIVLDLYELDRDAFGLGEEPVDPIGINVRTRTGPNVRGSRALDDAVYELLDGAEHLDLHGVHVLTVGRQSSTSLGKDASGRRERSSNYYALAQRATAHRPQ